MSDDNEIENFNVGEEVEIDVEKPMIWLQKMLDMVS